MILMKPCLMDITVGKIDMNDCAIVKEGVSEIHTIHGSMFENRSIDLCVDHTQSCESTLR